jgi:rfaE bifunctional protein kinase chain/domain
MKIESAPTPSFERVNELLWRAPRMRILVMGDFFLDKYLVTDPVLSELSIETGLEARQVVDVRCNPGAAGTVTNNLAALEVGQIHALGVIGDDGEGYELVKGLEKTRVQTKMLFRVADRFTPTYTKPMIRTGTGEIELERLDIKNHRPLSTGLEAKLIEALEGGLRRAPRAVVLLDQVYERNTGVITDCIRNALPKLAAQNPSIHFFADSRERIGEFKGFMIKPNIHEAARALNMPDRNNFSLNDSAEIGLKLREQIGKDVFLTLGVEGILVCGQESVIHVPALPVSGEIDIVGAGDSATAGIVTALCAGASPVEAAYLGNLCAAVTIRKLGTTGTVSQDEIRQLITSLGSA